MNIFFCDPSPIKSAEFIRQDKEWYDIPNYEGYYQITKTGNVKGVNRTVYNKRGKGFYVKLKGIMIKREINNKGYYFVRLTKGNITKVKTLHRLIAETFIPKIKGKNVVGHIDNNPKNVSINNLEWCTAKENVHHAIKCKRHVFPNVQKGAKHPCYGKKISDKHKKAISEANKGKVFSEEHRKNLSKACKGRKFSAEHIEKLRKARIGKEPWNKGLKGLQPWHNISGLKYVKI